MRISQGESLVMEALWQRSPLTAEDIGAALATSTDWSQATVKTLINRLLNKSAIAAERDGRRFLYRPVVQRADFVTHESQGLLDRLFDGRLAPLITHFSDHQRLTPEDVAELKALIERMEDGR